MRSRIWAACALCALLTLWSGCARKVDKLYDPVQVDEVPVPSALTATVADRQIDLSWSVDPADASSILRYLVYRADSGGTVYHLQDSTSLTSYSDLGVLNDVLYGYRVSARSTAKVEGEQSSSVSARPTLLSIRINADSLYTSRLIVGVAMTAAGAQFMRIANDTMQPGSWIPFQSLLNWTLSSGAGPKRVWAQFRMSGGVESSGWIFDDIVFDDRAQIASVTISDSVLLVGESMNVFVATGEPGGVATYAVGSRSNQKLFDDGVAPDVAANDGTYSGVYVASSLDLFEGSTLTAQFTDKAANHATETPAPWSVSVRQPPGPPVWISIEPNDLQPTELTLSWVLGQAKPFSHLIVRRATTPGAGLAGPIIRTITSAGTTTLLDTGLVGGTTYYYTLEVVLTNGLRALSAEASATTAINLPPAPVSLAVLSKPDSSLDLTWSRSDAADFANYRVYRADSASQLASSSPSEDLLVDIITDQDKRTHTEEGLTRLYYFRVFVFDRGGLGVGSNTVSGPKEFAP